MDIRELSVYGKTDNENKGVFSGASVSGNEKNGQIAGSESAGSISNSFFVDINGTDRSVRNDIYSDRDADRQDMQQVAESQAQAKESLAILNGEDYRSIEEKEGSFSKSNQDAVERAAERIKESKEWKANVLLKNSEFREMLDEGMEKLQQSGFLEQKSLSQLQELLQEEGIFVNQENVAELLGALGMGTAALEMTDESKAYVIGQDLPPTIENLYQGKFRTQNVLLSQNAEAGQEFEAYQQQIEEILADCGQLDEEHMEAARWLFDQELPINESTLGQLAVLQDIQENTTKDQLLEQILFAVSSGEPPKAVLLDSSAFVSAKEAVAGFSSITDQTVLEVAQQLPLEEGREVTLELLQETQDLADASGQEEMEIIPPVYAGDMTEQEIQAVTLKRQLEEIRQKMTLQSAVAMEQKGIHVETEALENIIRQLRQIENTYYTAQAVQDGTVPEAGQMDLLQETMEKAADIAKAPAAILGAGSIRQQQMLTMNELHAAVGSETLSKTVWNETYETVSTQVRSDLGDSIQKAFSGISGLLGDLGMEDTQANERAVRILGYNSMEITEENITQVKYFDAKVNQVIDSMKPAAVLELIRRGVNPLNISLDELQEQLDQISSETDVSGTEKYSRFLWQMERDGLITEDERSGYIGIYRLLNQIEKTDGAVIGAALEANQELTLGNLLTQARIRKGQGIDARIDEKTGFGEGSRAGNSITDQIEKGFAETQFYRSVASRALDEMTPSKIREISDGELSGLLNCSLEQFEEKLKEASGNPELTKEYFEIQAQELREGLADSEDIQEYLKQLQIEDTVENVITAKALLQGGSVPYRDFFDRKKEFAKKQSEELEELVDSFDGDIETEDALNSRCERAEKFISDVLTKSQETADINFEDLKAMQMLGQGFRLQGLLRQSRSYEIPIRTGDSITSLNLTLIHGEEETGKVQISMDDGKCGRISMDFKVADSSVKGLVLCDQRYGFEALQEQAERFKTNLENAGYQVKNISYGMDFKSRNDMLNKEASQGESGTDTLYRFAKIAVRWAADVIREAQ
ncbi:MAG: DUF6240 domain-containing protein [Clostridiaceae bacterium]|nr:DUF6240 domain-containing protein [Clostridiaceae bacterium]